MLRLRYLALLAVTVLLLLGLLDRAQNDDSIAALVESSPLAENYDYYITGMNTTRFLASGQPEYRMQAARVTHYPDGDIALLEEPRFYWYREQAQPWQVEARAGTLAPDPQRGEDRLELTGEVLLNQSAADGRFMEVRTETLTVFPAFEEILTAAAVNLRTQDSSIDSIGMHAWLEQNRIKLLNDVRGTYDQTAR